MDKQQILNEIRRTAVANGGVPLGKKRFERETGIRDADWYGKIWPNWSDAVRDAGYSANGLKGKFESNEVLLRLVDAVREFGHFPGTGELRLKKRIDRTFPNSKVFYSHFGNRDRQKRAVLNFCRSHAGYDDVVSLVGSLSENDIEQSQNEVTPSDARAGFVYMMRYGRHYKIGKTNATGRREYEIAIQLPEKVTTVHVIKTDDPEGIEYYWHKRFAAKRGNGEWFELNTADVQAFKRRKFM